MIRDLHRWSLLALLALAGCGSDGPGRVVDLGDAFAQNAQSALGAAGVEAERLGALWRVLIAGAAVIWVLVIALAVFAVRLRPRAHERRTAVALIVGGGVVFPTVVLTALLAYGLVLTRDLRLPADPDTTTVEVVGELWWWRVTYVTPDGRRIESANEVRLPVGSRSALRLSSPNVIHSFWVPSLAGKMDLIPGRVNELVLEPTAAGTFRGECAEFCGAAHALMAFSTVTMPQDDFTAWLEDEAAPVAAPDTPRAERGRDVFLTYGCGACHTVRGTEAGGRLGPDLTHVGSRASLGAGVLPNEPEDFAAWIGHTQDLKPEVYMPSFDVIPEDDLEALAIWLDGLR